MDQSGQRMQTAGRSKRLTKDDFTVPSVFIEACCFRRHRFDQARRNSVHTPQIREAQRSCGLQTSCPWPVKIGSLGQ